MVEYLEPDICVIGAGSGGLMVAAAVRALGGAVVLIERDKMGGDCLNYGCVPSKAMIAAAKRAHTITNAGVFGVSASELRVNFGRVAEHVRSVVETIAPHDSVERFEALGANVIKAHARFVDKRTVEADGQLIRARRFVIATGSRPAVPPIPGLETINFLTNETIFNQTRKPEHLIVIGGGPIGMELAQAHRRLGAQVSVIEMFEPLGKDDPELTAIALRKIEAEGVKIYAQSVVESVESQGRNVAVRIKKDDESEIISGSHILVAAGRTKNVDDLGLEAARIRLNNGAIRVNRSMKTTNRRVYAIGDVAGSLQFTHVAGYHAGLVVRNALFGLPVKENRDILPWATYTDPEIAQVGLSEAEAKKRFNGDFKVMRVPFTQNDRAQAERRTEGLVKLITDNRGRILGAGIVGAQAGELVTFFAYAIANRMRVSSLTKFVAPYPTIAEIVKRVGNAYYHDKLDNPWLARLRNFNRLLP